MWSDTCILYFPEWVLINFKDLCGPGDFLRLFFFWALIWKTITFDLALKGGNTVYGTRRKQKTVDFEIMLVYPQIKRVKLVICSVIKEISFKQ